MKITLKDGAPRRDGECVVNISKKGNTIEVGADEAFPHVVLEHYDGRLRLRVYAENTGFPGPKTDAVMPDDCLFVFDLNTEPVKLETPAEDVLVASVGLTGGVASVEVVRARPDLETRVVPSTTRIGVLSPPTVDIVDAEEF